MTIIIYIILTIHGLIHLIGFAKAFGLAEIEALTMPISRPWGLVWLVAALLFALTAILRLSANSGWWVFGMSAVVVSQTATIAFWGDAKFGTLANVALSAYIVLQIGAWSTHLRAEEALSQLLGRAEAHTGCIESADRVKLDALPDIVRHWIKGSGALDGDSLPLNLVYIEQTGRMRTSPDANWMPFEAQQWFTPSTPGFVWLADVTGPMSVHISGIDQLFGDFGSMRIAIASLLPVVNEQGPRIGQGAMVRYLAEMVWFPPAALCEHISWTTIDDQRAQAMLTVGDESVQGTFTFDKDANVVGFEAKRYLEEELQDWVIDIPSDSTRTLNGWRVPTEAAIIWRLKDGDWRWLELEVQTLKRNAHTPRRVTVL